MKAHRNEIDGLRAFAILPVILFHAGFKSFEGGFIGVDIFFVISGYLITNLIINNLNQINSLITESKKKSKNLSNDEIFLKKLILEFTESLEFIFL